MGGRKHRTNVYNSPKPSDALDRLPFQGLRDDLEYKFLGCIEDDHQLRIAIGGALVATLMIQPQVPEYSRPFQLSLFR